jgi:hypothetical protein
MIRMMNQTNEMKAIQYAEKYGVVEYTIEANEMIYSVWSYGEGTYTCKVDLDMMKETRTLQK